MRISRNVRNSVKYPFVRRCVGAACPRLQIARRVQRGDFFGYREGDELVYGDAFSFGKVTNLVVDIVG